MPRHRIKDSLAAAALAGGLTAIWFGTALLRFVNRGAGGFVVPPPWGGLWVFEVWCPASSAATAALLIWLASSWAGRVPSLFRGAAAGVGTVFLAPYLCIWVFWRGVLTFGLVETGNLSGLIAMMTHAGSWPMTAPIAAVAGGLLGWSMERRERRRATNPPGKAEGSSVE